MILVTGSTGQVGAPLVEELVGLGADVRVLTRAATHPSRGVEVVEGSFDDEDSLRQALDGVQRLFLLTPTGVDEAERRQRRLIDLAVAAGVEHVVKQSVIAAAADSPARIMRAHRRAEEHLERSGLAWTHLRPHWFMQNELGQAPGIAADGTIHAPDVTLVSMIDARDVAAAAGAVLTGDGHAGRTYVLTGPESLSYADLADRYARVLGRQISWTEVSLEEARASMIASGLPEELARALAEIMALYREGGVTADVSPAFQTLTGRPPRSFEQFVRDHADLHRQSGSPAPSVKQTAPTEVTSA